MRSAAQRAAAPEATRKASLRRSGPQAKGLLERRRLEKNKDGRSRYFDHKHKAIAVKLLPGEHYVTDHPDEMIVTVLGSCVAACIRNPLTGFGGMNHFMLPQSSTFEWGGSSAAMRFGNHAMEALINDIIRSGCPRELLEIKVFGGGNVIKSSQLIGQHNADFVLKYLENEKLRVLAADLGGNYPRRIHFFPNSGLVKRLYLRRSDDQAVFKDESKHMAAKPEPQEEGSIDLFTD